MSISFLNDRRTVILATLSLVFLIAIYVFYLLQPGGIDTVKWTIDTIVGLLTIGAVVQAVVLWRSTRPGEVSRWIWGSLGLGLGLWLASDISWGFTQAIPVRLSIGDAAWMLGYIPLYVALILRYRSIGMAPSRGRLAVVLGWMLAVLAVATTLVVVPALTSPAYQSSLLNVPDAWYALCDLGLALAALLVMSVFSGGALSGPWALIAASFLMLAASDLFFVYAMLNGIYVQAQPNLVTLASDLLYPTGYLTLAGGLYLQGRVFRMV